MLLMKATGKKMGVGNEAKDAGNPLAMAVVRGESVLRAMLQTHGEFHPNVSDDLAQLATLYNINSEHEKALTLLHKRLVIHEKHGPDDLIGETLQALGTTYRLHGVVELAQQHLDRALAVRESCHGANSHKVAETLNSLALLSLSRNDANQAEEFQIRSLEIMSNSTEPEDIESEDIPWEVYKRLRQQRGPSTAANSITLFKGTLRKCVTDAFGQSVETTEAEDRVHNGGGREDSQPAIASFFGAMDEQKIVDTPRAPTPPPHALSVGGRNGRSQSDSAMARMRLEQARMDEMEGRMSGTLLEMNADGDDPHASGTTERSTGQLPPFRRPSQAVRSPKRVYTPLEDMATVHQRVEDVKRRIVAGAPDMEMEVARLASDIELIESPDLRQVGHMMLSLLRDMHRLSIKSDHTRQLPVLEGLLDKKSASIFRGWERRFFKVDPKTFVLSYHYSQDDYVRGFAPRGGFSVARISRIMVHRQPRGGHFHFDVVVDLSTRLNPHASRTYELRCETEQTVRYWVETLQYYKATAESTLRPAAFMPPRPGTS
ncbi:hypothetical protein Poli38472_005655 [Pythium oligandrum]|uniref:PH domain-containing protein n=1 Tax=Pythium oligandrum TaxID=41045 RepID=A0A8K1CGP0_PYTOL|nr:hypothetical protein Poli38472_005655 [Pythium oligandrum]|eukprot:TMW63037.1 hypothetical protein Poli38472_005655 [Pythium oligandrum]